jgi:hypothetical protein
MLMRSIVASIERALGATIRPAAAAVGLLVLGWCFTTPNPASELADLQPHWETVTGVVKTALSIQVCPEPPLRRGSPIHDQLFQNLHDLHADLARLQPWRPYPRLAVAELEPPANGQSSWDFTLIDPLVEDFFAATKGHPVMLDFGEIPDWMFRGAKSRSYPLDPNEIARHYGMGEELRDPTLSAIRDYYLRLAGWYLDGGFTDEFGTSHRSGHHYKVAYWEVLNEPDLTHYLDPILYTRIYDEVVLALKQRYPLMKFSALALAWPDRPEYIQYFLNPRNHRPGVPLDMISYHFYAVPELDETPEIQEHTFFTQADALLSTARYIDTIRHQLSPGTRVYVDEVGSLTSDSDDKMPDIAGSYWNLSGSMFAYLYLRVLQLGLDIDALAASELIDYPGQAPGASLSDWNTGKPNARYQVLRLLHDGVTQGDQLVETMHRDPQIYAAQALLGTDGGRKILVVNKRNRLLELRIAGGVGARVDYVDQTTGSGPPAHSQLASENLALSGYGVAIVYLTSPGAGARWPANSIAVSHSVQLVEVRGIDEHR